MLKGLIYIKVMKFIITKLVLNYFNIHKDKVNILLINRILCNYMLIPNSHYMIKMKYMSCMLKLNLHLFLYKYVLCLHSCLHI